MKQMKQSAYRQQTTHVTTDYNLGQWNNLASNQTRRNEVTIWWADLTMAQSRLGRPSDLLPPDERRRADWMLDPEARNRWMTGRASLRTILSGYLGLEALAVPIRYGALGKPEVGNLSPVRFNLSSSRDLVAIAVAWRKPLGIDVQYLRDDVEINELAEWTFSEDAYSAWLRLPESERRISFARTWARKEAYLKGRGVGLTHPLRDLSIVESHTPGAVAVTDKHLGGIDQQWRVFDLSTPDPRFTAALAVGGDVSGLISRGWPDGSVKTTWRQR